MTTSQGSIGQSDFGAGVFHDTADYLIPGSGLVQLKDAFLQEDGAAIERGGTSFRSGAAFGTSLRWVWDGYFDAGQRTLFANADDFGVLDSDEETVINLGGDGLTQPARSAWIPDTAEGGLLFIGGGYIYGGSRKAATYSTGTVTLVNGSTTVDGSGVTWNTLTDAGMLFQRGNERVYRVASFTDTNTLELAEPYEGTGGSGISYTLSNIYEITDADPYPDASWYAVSNNRLIWASGNELHGSEPSRPHDLTAPIGGEDIPLVHALPEGVRILHAAAVGLATLCFTTQGIWRIDGLSFDIVDVDGNLQHTISRYSGEHILWDGNGVASWQDALVVPCVNGIWLLDGASDPVQISHPIDETVMEYVRRGYKLGQAAVHRGHYLLPVYSGTSNPRACMVCRINRPIKIEGQTVHPWSFFEYHAEQIVAFAVHVGDDTREPVLIGADISAESRVLDCPFFDPGSSTTEDANGDVPILDLVTRAYATGGGTSEHGPKRPYPVRARLGRSRHRVLVPNRDASLGRPAL